MLAVDKFGPTLNWNTAEMVVCPNPATNPITRLEHGNRAASIDERPR
jgi:hypothetical protein